MTQKLINLGQADKGNGDPLRTAFGKVNDNFTELYGAVGSSIIAGDEMLATETYVNTALLAYQQQLEIDGGDATTDFTAEILIDGGAA